MSTGTDDIIDYERHEASRDAYRYQQEKLQETIQTCARTLEADTKKAYVSVATTLSETILPSLRDHASKPFDEYQATDTDADDWYWDEFAFFVRSPQKVITTFKQSSDPSAVGRAKTILERALSTTARVAEREGIIKGQYTRTAEAVGLSGQTIGRVYKDPKMPFGDEVEIIIEAGTIKSFYAGGTNTGKSTGAEAQFQDYYWRNFVDGKKNTKCIDPFDFSVGENIFYDVPQGDEDLRDALEEMDLPKDFTETDLDPELEVFIPLSPRLEQPGTKLPYDTETDEFVPNPFVVPAADISQDLFISLLSARVSNTESDTLREVYESVDRERSDWQLKHLADEIADRDELSDKHQRKAIRVIRSLQDFGFIRDSTSDLTLDWDRIFRETDTVTVFNQLLCRNKRERLFVLAWILEQMWDERTQIERYPQMAMMLREMWAYAPQKGRREDDDICAALQERIVNLLVRYLRQNRDIRTHVVGDSQNLRDIDISVREEFNRYCLFEAKRWMAEKIFDWTGNEAVDSFVRTIPPDVGECGIVGAIGPAMEHSRVEYVSPVAVAPPTHHHHDKDDGNGFLVRTEMVENEEPRSISSVEDVSWPTEVPKELQIPEPAELLEDDEEDEEGGSGSSDAPTIKDMHRQEARERRKKGISYRKIAQQIPDNPDRDKPYDHTTIMKWTSDIDPTQHGDGGDQPDAVAD